MVLEHRYYGASFPYWPNANLSTDSLRFLNNYEALEDSASFIRDVSFEGVDGKTGPVIYYGGSYAGARAAHMRCVLATDPFRPYLLPPPFFAILEKDHV